MTLIVEKICNMGSPVKAPSLPRGEKDTFEARVTHRLRRSPYPDIRRIMCEFHEGMLFLRGRVSSYYLKQIAQTMVLEISGLEEISNQLEVVTPTSADKQNVSSQGSIESKALGSVGDGIFHKEDV